MTDNQNEESLDRSNGKCCIRNLCVLAGIATACMIAINAMNERENHVNGRNLTHGRFDVSGWVDHGKGWDDDRWQAGEDPKDKGRSGYYTDADAVYYAQKHQNTQLKTSKAAYVPPGPGRQVKNQTQIQDALSARSISSSSVKSYESDVSKGNSGLQVSSQEMRVGVRMDFTDEEHRQWEDEHQLMHHQRAMQQAQLLRFLLAHDAHRFFARHPMPANQKSVNLVRKIERGMNNVSHEERQYLDDIMQNATVQPLPM